MTEKLNEQLWKTKDWRHKRWSIGIYTGSSLMTIGDRKQICPVLTPDDIDDIPAALIADPFMMQRDNRWYMFFEVLNAETLKGEISLATSDDAINWKYEKVIIAEDFHLSYPHIVQHNGEVYLIPESYKDNSLLLYRAVEFPYRWEVEQTLLEGHFVDTSFFQHDGLWWFFSQTKATWEGESSLYYAPDLKGPWQPHAQTPLFSKQTDIARPGGRVVVEDGKIIRLAQDCSKDYGGGVRAFEVTKLSTTEYEERPLGWTLRKSGMGWNARGMHHVDAHRLEDGSYLACVDGNGQWRPRRWDPVREFIPRLRQRLSLHKSAA